MPDPEPSQESISFPARQSILVFGAGAIGSLVGGLLSRAGHSLCFVGRQPVVQAIRANGLAISGIWGEYEVPPTESAFECVEDIPHDFKPDIVLIATKSTATAQAIDACRPLLGPDTYVCTLQNGIGNLEIVAQRIGWPRTFGGRVITGVEIDAQSPDRPVAIRVTVHADDIRLGHPRRTLDRTLLEGIAATWRDAGIRVQATDDLVRFLWAKLFYNAALNPLGAILGVRYGDLAAREGTRQTMDRIVAEGFAATHAHGIEHFWPDAASYLEAFYGEMVPKTAEHFPSMLRDIERGRLTEIAVLNGAIVRLGEEAGTDVTTNRTIVEMIAFLEQRNGPNRDAE